MAGSLLPTILPVIADAPVLPPLGLLMLLGWRLMRPEVWPLWMALPLGLFDDLATGHPVGTAMALWTFGLIAIEAAQLRLLWRDYVQDWLIAAIVIIAVTMASWAFMAMARTGAGPAIGLAFQIVTSILAFPIIARLCAALDRWRLP
jgi:rod shape-determining protein MreD